MSWLPQQQLLLLLVILDLQNCPASAIVLVLLYDIVFGRT